MQHYLAVGFSVTVSLLLPLAVLIWLLIKKRSFALPFGIGAACFLVSQLLLRIPLLSWLGTKVWFVAFGISHPALYALLLGFSAGLFEEIGRYICMRLLRRHRGFGNALSFGAGHGGFEAAVLVGINHLVLALSPQLLFSLPASHLAVAGVERIFAIIIHIGLSVMVMRAVCTRRIGWLFLAIALHGIINSVAVLLQQAGASMFAIEGAVALGAILLVGYTIFERSNSKKWETSYEKTT